MTGPDQAWRGACVSDPEGWDLDHGTLTSWMRAAAICQNECPFLAECQQLPGQVQPVAAIMAGVGYGDSGIPLDTAGLRRYWATKRNRARRDAVA